MISLWSTHAQAVALHRSAWCAGSCGSAHAAAADLLARIAIQPICLAGTLDHEGVGRHVLADHGAGADEGVCANVWWCRRRWCKAGAQVAPFWTTGWCDIQLLRSMERAQL